MSDCRQNCPIPDGGFCPRHGVRKLAVWVRLCRHKAKYWKAWEEGRGIGQGVEHPIIPLNSHVGDILEELFTKWGMQAIPTCGCAALKWAMNCTPAEEILAELPRWASRLQKSARQWKQHRGGAWRLVPAPPRVLCRRVIRQAAMQSQRDYPPLATPNVPLNAADA